MWSDSENLPLSEFLDCFWMSELCEGLNVKRLPVTIFIPLSLELEQSKYVLYTARVLQYSLQEKKTQNTDKSFSDLSR